MSWIDWIGTAGQLLLCIATIMNAFMIVELNRRVARLESRGVEITGCVPHGTVTKDGA